MKNPINNAVNPTRIDDVKITRSNHSDATKLLAIKGASGIRTGSNKQCTAQRLVTHTPILSQMRLLTLILGTSLEPSSDEVITLSLVFKISCFKFYCLQSKNIRRLLGAKRMKRKDRAPVDVIV